MRGTDVPGPCAMVAALSIAGMPTDRFVFEGFLPARDGPRRARLRELKRETRTMVFYEAARRCPRPWLIWPPSSAPSREAAVVREATKVFEEVVRGTLGHLADRWKDAPPGARSRWSVAGAGVGDRHAAL